MSPKFFLPVMAAVLLIPIFPTTAQQAGQDFPDGPGKSIVIAQCGRCHELNRVMSGFTPEGWRSVIRTMQNFGMELPQDQVSIVIEYLIRSFPEKGRPSATLILGVGAAAILEQVCDQRGVCCLGETDACFGTDVRRRLTR
jgi:virginiamycin B lyase